MKLYLLRDYSNPAVTIGRMFNPNDNFHIHTLELPWKDNQKRISCIPEDIYIAERGYQNRGGYETFELRNVPNRTHIKFDRANYPRDILGCIALGMSRDINHPAVWSSKVAQTKFMDYLKGIDRFKLDIRSI